MKNLLSQEILARSLVGDRVRMPLGHALGGMYHRNGLIFLGLLTIILALADPSYVRSHVSWPVATLIWIASVFFFIVFYMCWLTAWAQFVRMTRQRIMHTPLVVALSIFPTVVIIEYSIYWASGQLYSTDIPVQTLFFYGISLCGDTIFVKFVLPMAVPKPEQPDVVYEEYEPAEQNDSDMPEPEEAERSLLVGGEKLLIRRVKHVEAREHFVTIHLESDEITHRARLSDIVAQTKGIDGVQPHRSWWVSRHADPKLMREESRYFLVLDNNTKIPVARGRVRDVQEWLEKGNDKVA